MDSLKMMILLYQPRIIDSLTLLQFCINCISKYAELTVADAASCMGVDITPRVLLAPAKELKISYQYIQTAKGFKEKKERIMILSSFLAMSNRALLTDPATNAAVLVIS